MVEALEVYFRGEKQGGAVATLIGLLCLVVALVYGQSRWGIRSYGITVGVLGVVVLAIGLGLYFKTDAQVAGLLSQLATDRRGFFEAELARMTGVQNRFVILEYTWVVVLSAGSLVAVVMKQRPGVCGVACGLVAFAAMLLCFDIVAERRGATYLAALKENSGGIGQSR